MIKIKDIKKWFTDKKSTYTTLLQYGELVQVTHEGNQVLGFVDGITINDSYQLIVVVKITKQKWAFTDEYVYKYIAYNIEDIKRLVEIKL